MNDFIPAFGRIEDLAAVEAVFSQMVEPLIAQAAYDVIHGADDNADVDLCAIYETIAGRPWDSLNQNPRGFCVGFGNAKMATLTLAMMAHAGEISWPGADVAVEPIYGGNRYEVGYKTYNSGMYRGGDGGVGSWAAEWLIKWGVLLKQSYGTTDLTNYSMDRCDYMGSHGVPDDIEDDAKLHPLQKMALCGSGQEAWALMGQLHPLVHCSNQGFAMERRSDGTCADNDVWPHCAGWSGRFTLKNNNPYLRYENSWDGKSSGVGYLGQPVIIEGRNGPIKLNGNQFLVPLEIVDRICRRGRETYSMAGALGFTKRRPTLLI
jgi:hypothetical protein